MKKNEMVFYQLLRNFLNDYLIMRRNLCDKTVRAYWQTFVLLRNYYHEEKGIRFDRMDFNVFPGVAFYRTFVAGGINLRITVLILMVGSYCV